MSQINEVIVISSDEEETPTPTPDRAQSRPLAQEWSSQFRVAYDEWMYCPDYEASGHEILLVAEKAPRPPDRSTWIEDAVRNINRSISDSEVSDEDLVGLSLTAWRHERQHQVVVIGMRRKEQVKKIDLLKAFDGIERDRPAFLNSGPLVVKVKHVKRKTEQRVADVSHFHKRCLNKKCILSVGAPQSPVENLSRALALSEAYIRKDESSEMSKEYNKLRVRKEICLKEKAAALLRTVTKATGDDVDTALRDFDTYYTTKYTITVFLGLDGRHVLFESWAPPLDGRPQMNIVTDGREFHVVKPDKEAFSAGLKWKYCRLCRVHYRFEAEHECLECCRHCRRVGVCIPRHGISCRVCKRDFVSDSCFRRHREKTRGAKSTCDVLKKCKKCLEWYNDEGSSNKHHCNQRFCQNCRNMRPVTHTCHASRQPKQVRAHPENGRSLRGADDDSDSVKRPCLDVDPSVHSATRGMRAEASTSATASTSHEPVDKFDSSETATESANSSSGPATRLTTDSTLAPPRDRPLFPGICLNFRPPTPTRFSFRSEVARASANGSCSPTERSSTAVEPRASYRSTGRGSGSAQNTSAQPSHRPASLAAGNQQSRREEVRVGSQRGDEASASADLPNEEGNMAPIPLQAYLYPQDGRVELFGPNRDWWKHL